MNRYCFTFITDKNYLKFSLVAILNLLKTKKNESFYKIYLIYSGKDKLNISSYLEKFQFNNYNIEIIYFDNKLISNFKGIRHVSNATYIKYFIPDLINEKSVLFLDADIYINKNIENIWNEWSDEYSIMAIEDPGYKYENLILGIDKDAETFNAGVLLLNLEKMRNIDLCKKLIEYTNENGSKIQNADQSVFNALCKNDWKKIPCSYNMQRIHFINSTKKLKINKKILNEYKADPFIIHFTTHSKPWMFRSAHPYKKKYINNYNDLFKFKYNDKTIINAIKRIYEYCQYFKSNLIIRIKGAR